MSSYNDGIARRFFLASAFWGLFGMAFGLVAAVQLLHGQANHGPLLTFGRLRPVHSQLSLFAFLGNAVFGGIFYFGQRLMKTRLYSDRLAAAQFWGWQCLLLALALTLPLGMTDGKEYLEPVWWIDVGFALVGLLFAWNFGATLARRRESRLYISLWFYLAGAVVGAVVFLLNAFLPPVAGSPDALLSAWSSEMLVTFVIGMPLLGLLYDLLPRTTERAVYSHRLAIVHFWGLILLVPLVGAAPLLNTVIPDWTQSLGVVASILLFPIGLAVLWNACLTMRDAKERQKSPAVTCLQVALTFYGVALLQAVFLRSKSGSGLLAFTDAVVGHIHTNALGFSGFLVAALFYHAVPRLFATQLHSERAARAHIWLCTLGAVLYLIGMAIAGVTQGLMWRAEQPDGGLLYPSFVETLLAVRVMHAIRLVGGLLYLCGFAVLCWNLWKTSRAGGPAETDVPATSGPHPRTLRPIFGAPVAMTVVVFAILLASVRVNTAAAVTLVLLAIVVAMVCTLLPSAGWHRRLEEQPFAFALLILFTVAGSSLVELAPVLTRARPSTEPSPYSALELAGRRVYVEEGCPTCHSQLVRPFLWESARYPGGISTALEGASDRPVLWGMRRIGPDLARVGGKYPHSWHYDHLLDPRAVSPGSNMPSYAHLRAQRSAQPESATAQARKLLADMQAEFGSRVRLDLPPDSKLIALIAYLQRLGPKGSTP